MSVKEEVLAAMNDLILPKLAEIEKNQTELKARLDEVIKRVDRMGRPLNDFDHIEDLEAAGMTKEQAYGIIQAKYEMKRAPKADLEETALKVGGDLEAVGFNPKKAKAIVELIKDWLAA
jgi:uncharacterized protein (UPF0335 family)